MTRDQRSDPVPVGKAHLALDQLTLVVKDEKGGNTPDVVALSYLSPQFAEYAQPYDLRLPFQVPLQPIHDGFGQQAGRSGVAEHLHDDCLTPSQYLVQPADPRSAVAQQQERR